MGCMARLLLLAGACLAQAQTGRVQVGNAIRGDYCEFETHKGKGNGDTIVDMQENQYQLELSWNASEVALEDLIHQRVELKKAIERHQKAKQAAADARSAQDLLDAGLEEQYDAEKDWSRPVAFDVGPDTVLIGLTDKLRKLEGRIMQQEIDADNNRTEVEKVMKEIYDSEPRKWIVPVKDKQSYCDVLFDEYPGKMIKSFTDDTAWGPEGPIPAGGCPQTQEQHTFIPLKAVKKGHVAYSEKCSHSCEDKCRQIADFHWYSNGRLPQSTLIPKCHCMWIVDRFIKGIFQNVPL